MRRKYWLAAAAAAAVTTAGIVVPTITVQAEPSAAEIADGCAVHGSYEVCFNDPSQAGDGVDPTLENRLRELTQQAGEGDSIRVSMFTWTRTEIAEDLVAAYERGVDVRIVLDGINKADQNEPWKILEASDIPLTSCSTRSCLGTNINHNKLYLFELGGVKSVVSSSANLTNSQLGLYNNMLKVDGDDKLYDFMMGFWNRMEAQSWTHDGVTWTDDDKAAVGSLATAGYAYPRQGDNVLWMLDSITECREGNNQIYVAQSLWTSPRTAIRDRLAELQDDLGCDVKVITESEEKMNWVQESGLRDENVGYLHESHNKLFMVNAKYLDEWQQVVFVGSHNLTGTSLETNDEAIVRVGDPAITQAYMDYYDAIFAKAGGV